MGVESVDRNMPSFHLHLPHLHHHGHGRKVAEALCRDVPKGCFAILVGQGAEQQRFVVPIIYLNHPLFVQLLKEAEDEYGFDQKGTINIPCHVAQFQYVQGLIDKDKQHSSHHVGCFRA
ncbi:Auxin-responsive protein [Nymphaea thermarum]|nr:Auxin-responsive protein [Nymphaea thermarum]